MVGVAMDAMAVAIHIKYALNLKPHLTSYSQVVEMVGRTNARV